jgi:hypothetical protein
MGGSFKRLVMASKSFKNRFYYLLVGGIILHHMNGFELTDEIIMTIN